MKENEVPVRRETDPAGEKTAFLAERFRLVEEIEDMGADGGGAKPAVPAEGITQGLGFGRRPSARRHPPMGFRRHGNKSVPPLLEPPPQLQESGIRILHDQTNAPPIALFQD